MHAVGRRGGALALLALVLLPALERPAGVEHPPEQPFLTLDDLAVEPPALEPLREILRLIRQLAGAGQVPAAAQLLQLLGQRALLEAELPELLPDGAASRHRQHAGALLTQAALLLRELRHPLERLGQSRARAGALHVAPRADELVRRRVEGVHRAARLLGALARVGRGVGDGFARALHLPLGAAERRADVRRNERVLAARVPHLLQQALDAFLDRPLLRAHPPVGIAAASELVLHRQLTLGQPAGLGQRLIERGDHLLAPLLLHILASPVAARRPAAASDFSACSPLSFACGRWPCWLAEAACRICWPACCARSPAESSRCCRCSSPTCLPRRSMAAASESARAASSRSDCADRGAVARSRRGSSSRAAPARAPWTPC